MNQLHIVDRAFAHCDYLAYLYPSSNFTWNRNFGTIKPDDIIVFTDDYISNAPMFSGKKIALMIEPEAIKPDVYTWIRSNSAHFDKIFTFDKELLSIGAEFVFYPYGTTWISEPDKQIYEKSEMLSIIASEKNSTEGHQLRHAVIRNEKDKEFSSMHVYGRGYSPLQNKIDGLKPYAFQIVIENSQKDYYFTEKLLDCFATGTIPIYWGCPSISSFFDINGIITFNSIDELNKIIDSLSFELYNSKLDSIKNNFNKVIDFIYTDDYIYKKITA